MFILDTDTLTHLQRGHSEVSRKVLENFKDVVITIISFQQQLDGWHSELHQVKDNDDKLAIIYEKMAIATTKLVNVPILPFSRQAIRRWRELKKVHKNFEKYDLRIGAIALEHKAVIVTSNFIDFVKIMPTSRIQDWTK